MKWIDPLHLKCHAIKIFLLQIERQVLLSTFERQYWFKVAKYCSKDYLECLKKRPKLGLSDSKSMFFNH